MDKKHMGLYSSVLGSERGKPRCSLAIITNTAAGVQWSGYCIVFFFQSAGGMSTITKQYPALVQEGKPWSVVRNFSAAVLKSEYYRKALLFWYLGPVSDAAWGCSILHLLSPLSSL